MNTPNPLIPQGSLLEQQKSKGKSNLFIAVFTILAIHVVLFAGLLMQGCKPDKTKAKADESGLMAPAAPTQESNTLAMPPSLPPPPVTSSNFAAETNISVPPTASSNVVAPLPTLSATPAPAPDAATTTPTVPTTPAAGKEYTVAKGDAFYKIAKANGISISALSKANPNVDSKKLKVGQKLIIPVQEAATHSTTETSTNQVAGTEPNATKESAKTAKTNATGAYTVKAGDTLAKIARAHGTTIKAIRSANALKSDQLHPGQKLKLPAHKGAEPAAAANPDATKI